MLAFAQPDLTFAHSLTLTLFTRRLQPSGPAKKPRRGSSKYSNTEFAWLSDKISKRTLQQIKYDFMKPFQMRALPTLSEGLDYIGVAERASGKRLAYSIQVAELLRSSKTAKEPGTKAMIMVANRKSAMKTYNQLRPLVSDEEFSIGVLAGGVDRDEEAKMLNRGETVIIALPGYLSGHIQKTKKFVFKHLKILVIDEADTLIQWGLEEVIMQILAKLPKRQTALFCAATTKSYQLEQLARNATNELTSVGLENISEEPVQLAAVELSYIVAKSELRFQTLYTLMRSISRHKAVILFSTYKQVLFHHNVLSNEDLPVLALHTQINDKERTKNMESFRSSPSAKLLATLDQVADLAMNNVEWFIQFDPPSNLDEFVRRAGRPAPDLRHQGNALLFLRPEEINVLINLREAKFSVKEYQLEHAQDAKFQSTLYGLVEEETILSEEARQAYIDYFRHYNGICPSQLFDSKSLDLSLVAKAYGFLNPAAQIFVPE